MPIGRIEAEGATGWTYDTAPTGPGAAGRAGGGGANLFVLEGCVASNGNTGTDRFTNSSLAIGSTTIEDVYVLFNSTNFEIIIVNSFLAGDAVSGSVTVTLNVETWSAIGAGGSLANGEGTWRIITPRSTTSSAIQTMQTSISRSQSAVTGKNIAARLAAAAGAGSQNQQSAAGFSPSFSGAGTGGWTGEPVSRGASLRDLAMLVSFDSSKTALSAAGDGQAQGDGILRRSRLAGTRPFTVWGHGSFTSVDNSLDGGAYGGDVWGFNIGMDYRVLSGLVAGLSASYMKTDVTTAFDSGSYDETSYTISPYAMYEPLPGLALSAIGGYGFGRIDRTHDDAFVTGETDSKSWFAILNADYEIRPSADLPLAVTSRVSFLMSHKTIDGYTESDGAFVDDSEANTLQLKPGLEITSDGFEMGDVTIQPFVRADFVYDFIEATNDDSTAYNLAAACGLFRGKRVLPAHSRESASSVAAITRNIR